MDEIRMRPCGTGRSFCDGHCDSCMTWLKRATNRTQEPRPVLVIIEGDAHPVEADLRDIMVAPEYVDRMVFEATKPKLPCLICGEDVPLLFEDKSKIKVCDKCKAAILSARQHMEAAESGEAILD